LGGRVAIVTGGGLGIGQAYCQGLARAGAAVVVADIDREAAAKVAASIRSQGGRALDVWVDVTDPAATEEMAAAAHRAFGRIDVLVNNAALYSALTRRPFHQIDVAEWDRVMAVNLKGLFLCVRAVYPYMRAQGGGRIINIASTTALKGTPQLLHYVTSKAGVIGFTRALARELGPDNITVNAIAPGMVRTGRETGVSDAYFAARVRERALAREQTPQDLVGAVLFLASDAAAFITGQTLVVDGGAVMH